MLEASANSLWASLLLAQSQVCGGTPGCGRTLSQCLQTTPPDAEQPNMGLGLWWLAL